MNETKTIAIFSAEGKKTKKVEDDDDDDDFEEVDE